MRVLLVVYDSGMFVNYFPQGIAAIAAALDKEGFDVEIYNQDIHHHPDDHLRKFLDKNHFDAVGLGVIAGYYQFAKMLKLSEAINASKNRPFFVLGGHGPTPEPKYFMDKTGADAIIMGEGEITIVELLKAVAEKRPLDDIQGIARRNGNKVTVNPARPQVDDIDTLPFPAYHLFDIGYYRMNRLPKADKMDFCLQVLSARGCTFKCTFCYRMDTGYRARGVDSLIEELRLLKDRYGITYVAFSDELLMASVPRVEEVCKALIKANLDLKWWCNGRINFARPDLLKLMKKAGCVFINYGIESMDDQVLKNMKKGLKSKWVAPAIEATLENDMSPGLNILFGNEGDTPEILEKGVDLLIKYGDASQLRTIRPVTPYPGSPLYYTALEKGFLKDCADFYENKHLNSDLIAVNFTDLTDDEFYNCLLRANKRLVNDFYDKTRQGSLRQVDKLYLEKDATFRGFRPR